jgi:hypothetical protein
MGARADRIVERGLLQKALAALLISVGLVGGCAATPRSTINLILERAAASPRDAAVYIDERFVGLLGVIARRGVRLPAGEHRITVERTGYFPWDALVANRGQSVRLEVELLPIPD